MVYLRGGTVVHQPSFLEEVLSIPVRIIQFIMFFFNTLIDVSAAPLLPCAAWRLTCAAPATAPSTLEEQAQVGACSWLRS